MTLNSSSIIYILGTLVCTNLCLFIFTEQFIILANKLCTIALKMSVSQVTKHQKHLTFGRSSTFSLTQRERDFSI